MKRKIITTADGSSTIQIEDWNEQYHSIHGAIQEANHVYIKHGFLFFAEGGSQQTEKIPHPEKHLTKLTKNSKINILEIGFGTGLNALLTFLKSNELDIKINYTGVEAYPISSAELAQLNYNDKLKFDDLIFQKMHQIPWEQPKKVSANFVLEKQQKFFQNISAEQKFDVIYFDAFGPRVQPELWTEDIFRIMYRALRDNGVLTTYSAKGSVRRALQTVGFTVERLEGPPGKREMLRGTKHSRSEAS